MLINAAVPGLKDNSLYNVRRGRLRLTGSDVSTIFEPVIKEVINLVNSQINATEAQVKAVLLVGGFSQSAYLRDRIRQAVASRGIETMQSPNSWTAVVRGALMKGLTTRNSSFTPVQISGRSARKSYGVEVDCAFDGNADNQGRRYVNLDRKFYALKADIDSQLLVSLFWRIPYS